MKSNIIKIFSLSLIIYVIIVSFYNIFGVSASDSIVERLKGKILLQVEDNGEAWYVNPDNLKKYYLGKPNDAFELMQVLGRGITNEDLRKIGIAEANFNGGNDADGDNVSDMIEDSVGTDKLKIDSDNDGYDDKKEILAGYNPLGVGKTDIDSKFSAKLAGHIVLQIESSGEAWYINPDNLKRYYLGKPVDAFNIMRKLGLGISNNDLAKIDSYYDSSEFSNNNIVKNNTVSVENGKRKYSDPGKKFSFEYDKNWNIKKYPDNKNIVFITDSKKDFYLENSAIIMITFVENNDLALDSFKSSFDGLVNEKEEKIGNYRSINQIYELDYIDKLFTVLEDGKRFVSVVLVTKKNNKNRYISNYKELIKSIKL